MATKLLLFLLKEDLAEEVIGDLDEKFYSICEKRSLKHAKRNYWYQVFNYARPFAIKSLITSKTSNILTMLLHYMKISWRTMTKNKVFSSIKIGGFSIGIAACILIYLFVNQELSYDNFYKDQQSIYRIAHQWSDEAETARWTNLQAPMKVIFEEKIPEVQHVARVINRKWHHAGDNHIRKVSSSFNSYEDGFFYADPEILKILEINMVYGNQISALKKPNTMVISKSKSDAYFPGENPIGQQVIFNDDPEAIYTIGGVMEDLPNNMHLQGDFILTLYQKEFWDGEQTSWCCMNYTYYGKFAPGHSKESIEGKLELLKNSYVVNQLKRAGRPGVEDYAEHVSYVLQPVQNIYLNPEQVDDTYQHGSEEVVTAFASIALVILMLACINFINLSTAKSGDKAKEVGIRKVVGSHRKDLIYQYLSESTLYSILSVALGLVLAWLMVPLFNQLADMGLGIPWNGIWFILSLLGSALLVGIVSGLYPAIYLSRFRPIAVLNKQASRGTKNAKFRSVMVVFQFVATIILIISAIVTHQQHQYFINSTLGYEKEQVVTILGMNAMGGSKEAFSDELLNLSEVDQVTSSDFLPVAGAHINNLAYSVEGQEDLENGFEAASWSVDEHYIPTMGMEMVAGRNFKDIQADENSIILNESMVQQLGLQDPIGVRLVDILGGKYNVIGVVKDFNFESLDYDVRPLAMVKGSGQSMISVKIKSENAMAAMSAITAVWDEFMPNQSIRYSFMDQKFEAMYSDFYRASNLMLVFAMLSVLIACLGLFALSAFIVEQRSKEISIRKVLGASVSTIFNLLTRDFLKLVIIAIVLAIPIGWYLMDELLKDFAHRIDLTWTIFLVSGLMGIIIALVTISFESIKAALINPAKKLRSE